MSIYITGDCHCDFKHIKYFCERFNLNHNDSIVICGDSGINYYKYKRNKIYKEYLNELGVTFLVVQGNHEKCNGELIGDKNYGNYKLQIEHNNKFVVEDKFPNIKFLLNGESYEIGDYNVLVVGGAYSVDKEYRIENNLGWWENEQPTEKEKERTIKTCENFNYKFDFVITHTAPLKYEPVEVFLNWINQDNVDKKTEIWLDELEDKLEYKMWYAGHYHTNKRIDNLRFLFNDIILLGD